LELEKGVEKNLILSKEEKRLLWAAMKSVEMLFDRCGGCTQGVVGEDLHAAVTNLAEKLAHATEIKLTMDEC
jgi:nitrogenase molybdenum-iron protein alpha/beta subunit